MAERGNFSTEQDQVFRLKTVRVPGTLARVLTAIGRLGARIGDIETLAITREFNVREVTVIAPNEATVPLIRQAIEATEGVELVDEVDKVFAKHEGGKLEVRPRVEVRNLQDAREIYTPGVARVSRDIARRAELADRYTWRRRTVAVISDGSRVLGLGNIGPLAALPVMEGKALFYSLLVDVNAVPIVLATQDPDEIIETVVNLAPGFGAIHLEDIASPGVYRIEQELDDRLDVPVLHDDQHGTAVVVLAAVLSAARLIDRPLDDLEFAQVGLGAAGSAIARLATAFPFRGIVVHDPSSAATDRFLDGRGNGAPVRAGSFDDATTADVLVLATGQPGLLGAEAVRPGQVIMALSNPQPEISIDEAKAAGAAIAADGSIVNNVLAYPGLVKGALVAGATRITEDMKRAAAEALAQLAPPGQLLPDSLARSVHADVVERVAEVASPRA